MARTLLPFLLFSIAASGGAGEQPQRQVRETRPAATERYIVEFHATPAAIAGSQQEAAAHDALFARFAEDLKAEVRAMHSESRREILREFRTAIVGASVQVHRATAERIRNLPYVRRVSIDAELRAMQSESPATPAATIDARARVNAAALGRGAGIVVAVIDTGIDYTHPALGGGFGPGFKVVGGYDFSNDDDDPMDDNGHGTHVAGIIAADSAQLTGVAPDVSLYAYKVLGANGSGLMSDAIAAMEHSLDPNGDGDLSDRVDVINLSLGAPGDADDPTSRAADNAVAAGVVVVAAAGNDGETASIRSPGTARRAITVAAIDDAGAVTPFSSRGPSPRLLGFKPDISAPGYEIVSTIPADRTTPLSGTSMASPHVAGVAALLLERHPAWSPDRIKFAITASAGSVDAAGFARGAGKLDAGAADAATLIADASGLSFGIRPSRTGTSTESQKLRLTNDSAASQTITFSAAATPPGATITVTPATLELPAGATGEVSVTLATSNDALPFPGNAILGGEIVISGASTVRIPWGILRTSRARITFDAILSGVVAVDSDGGRAPAIRDASEVEFYLPSGRLWDFMVTGWDKPAEGEPVAVRRTIVRQGVAIDGDHHFDFRTSEATLRIDLAGRDEAGVALRDRAISSDDSLHLQSMRLIRLEQGKFSFASYVNAADNPVHFYFSPLPENYLIHAHEQFADFEAREAYTVEHTPLEGLSADVVLNSGGTDLMSVYVAPVSRSRGKTPPLEICSHDALTASLSIWHTTCLGEVAGDGPPLRLHANSESFPYAHGGIVFRYDDVTTQTFRGREGRIVISGETAPSPVSVWLDPGDLHRLAVGPSRPFGISGTKRGHWFRFPLTGYYSGAGEALTRTHGVEWITWNSSGEQTGIGSLRDADGVAPPEPETGSRILLVRNDLPVGSRRTRGTLDVRFGNSETDLDAPVLTSLRLVDSLGKSIETIAPGAAATVRFSVADIDFAKAATSRESRPDLTSISIRRRGSANWISLPVTVVGTDAGSPATLKRYPVGDIYEATLPIMQNTDVDWYDLRIEFEDASGNRVEWVQEHAMTVGEPAASAPRRGVRP